MDTTVVSLAGDWDIGRRDELRTLLEASQDAVHLILDLRETTYIDSTALTELVRHYKARASRGLPVARYVDPTPSVRRILDLVSLSKVFQLYGSMEAAHASFSSPAAAH